MTTDQEVLELLQRAVIEPPDLGATWPSGLWTRVEMLGYVQQRHDRFLKETLCAVSWLDVPIAPGQSQQDLPDGWLQTRNAFFTPTDNSESVVPLLPLTRREADLLLGLWGADLQQPKGWLNEQWHTRQINLVPLPLTGGVLHLFAALTGQPLTGAGVALYVPDECMPYVFYGAAANAFGKQGRSFDALRRDYCEARYAEGIALTQAVLQAVVIS